MADEKKRSDKIYTHKSSMKARGEKPAEKPAAEAEAKPEGDAKPAGDGAGEVKAPAAAAEAKVKPMTPGEELAAVRERHKRESEEGHANYTKALDQMHARHSEEIDVAIGKHGSHLEGGPGVTAEEA